MMIRIENWSLVERDANPYLAPELKNRHLHGVVYGHPRWADGTSVVTSSIKDVDGCIVETHSGSVYELGEPAAEYVEWCKKNGVRVPTKEEPIKTM